MSVPAQTKIRGYEGQVWYGAAANSDTLFANVVDVDIDVKADSVDVSDHSTLGWKDRLGGLKEWTGTIKAMAIQSGVDGPAFLAALNGGSTLYGSFRPQDVTGGIAYTGTFVVVGFKHSMPNSGAQTLDISIEGRGPLVPGTVTTGAAA